MPVEHVAGTVERVARAERAAVLAAVARDVRDLELAEDCVQEALVEALRAWPRTGVPDRPGAWLTVVARRAAYRAIRRGDRFVAAPEVLDALAGGTVDADADAVPAFPDAQLELLFACCHPALALEAQVALTLRTVGGLTTPEIARAFLVPEATLAQRLVRAQRKLRDSGIPFAVPPPERLAERLDAVLGVIYLIFTEGYASPRAPVRVRADLCDRAVDLARLVATLLPDEPEALGLAALCLAHDARRSARLDPDGRSVPLAEQDRSRYDEAKIAEATGLLDRALGRRRRGPYQVQAAIACLHATAVRAEDTDWRQIAALYAALDALAPTPHVRLGQAAAVAMAEGPDAGLALLDAAPDGPGPELEAARAELLRLAGREPEAQEAFARALAQAPEGSAARADLTRRAAAA